MDQVKCNKHVFALILLACACFAWAQSAPLLFQCDGRAVLDLQSRFRAGDPSVVPAVKQLLASADKARADGPYSVVNKKHPLPGVDPHDYVSLAAYYWPNPDTPDHLPYVARDGQRNPEFADYDAIPLYELTDQVTVLSLAGYLTGDRKYSDRAAALVRAWFIDPATRMNPNFQHAQLTKGVDTGHGAGIIEARRFVPIIDSVTLITDASDWSPHDQAQFQKWIADFDSWLRTSKNGHDEESSPNNHGSWCDVQLVVYAMYAGDLPEARRLLEQIKTTRIARQIEPDGRQPLELARTRSFWYCMFNLMPLTELADLGQRVNVDLWNYQTPDGRSIRKAIDWLLPYASGDKPWTYTQINGFSAKELLIPLRRAELAYHDPSYESTITALKGQHVLTDEDTERPLWPRSSTRCCFRPSNDISPAFVNGSNRAYDKARHPRFIYADS